MPLQGHNILAVIPARGGSKGIARKNLRKLCGKTLIAHAAECARQIDWIDATILSTDDTEIRQHAKTLNIDVPFIRPQALAGDRAKSIDVWIHAWHSSETHYAKTFDISVLLEPTSPLRMAEDIKNAVELLINTSADTVATVSKTPAHYTPHKTLEISGQGYISAYLENGMQYSIRQNIPDYYHRNGVCYAATRASLLNEYNLMENKCAPLIIKRPLVNIDEEMDMQLAELLMQERQAP